MRDYWRFVARLLSILWAAIFFVSGYNGVNALRTWSFPRDPNTHVADATYLALLLLTLFIWGVAEFAAQAIARRKPSLPTTDDDGSNT